MIKTIVAALALAMVPVGVHATEKEDALLAKLRARIEAVDASLDGALGLSVQDLKKGATVIELRPAEPFPTASSIKLAILYELYRQAEEGRVDLAGLTTPPLPRVKGGGAGNQLVTVKIVMPSSLTDEERRLYEQLKALRNDNPRAYQR